MKNLVVRGEPGRTENGKEKHGRLGAVFGSACLSELALDIAHRSHLSQSESAILRYSS
jgi:hypothetical protein